MNDLGSTWYPIRHAGEAEHGRLAAASHRRGCLLYRQDGGEYYLNRAEAHQ